VGNGTPASCTEAALDVALAGGGTVTFHCGGPVVIPITAAKTLTATTTVDGTGQQVTLDGGGASRIFQTTYQFASFTITLRNLTLRNGRAADFGGAVRLVYQDHPTTLEVEGVRFESNVAAASGSDVGGGAIHAVTGFVNVRRSSFVGNRGGNGGAIGHIQARLTVEDTVFSGNSTHARVGDGGSGGAIYTDGSGNGAIVVRRSSFLDNRSTNLGGALFTYQYAGASSFTIEDSFFSGNATENNGGAVYHQNAPLSIRGSTFGGNTTIGQGGALWLLQSNPATIANCTFTANDAIGRAPNNGSTGLGGAILINASSVVTITHSTIVGNHADWVGGGITGGAGSSQTTLRGTIVAHNTADNGGNPWNIAHNCSTQLLDGGDNLQFPARGHPGDPNDPNCTASIAIADPGLGPLAWNGGLAPTLAPLPGSPAVDTVLSGCPPPSTDQRGAARPVGAGCDAGAVEVGAPFGVVDTPAGWASGVAGSVAVTGWALDDEGVQSVEIWRDAVAGEGAGPLFVGTATFVSGARPDVAAAYPGFPNADRAGWGYMLLTNMLPAGGNGSVRLHAWAVDTDGRRILLGARVVTAANATAAKPFGTIDTPGQGETVSGTIVNFGWALTPGAAVVPFDGSTITVYVDGVPIGSPTAYGLARADIDSLFPGYTNTGHAVGYRVIDTTALANGLHTLAWVVTDDQGRADGIGSRYFWVQN
jgi:hypothetical protein